MVADNAQSEGIGGKRYALAMLDRATNWLGFNALKSKSARDAESALRDFIGPRNKIESVYSGNSPELKRAVEGLGVSHGLSTPEQPQSNGVIERQVRHLLEGGQDGPRALWVACPVLAICRGPFRLQLQHSNGEWL